MACALLVGCRSRPVDIPGPEASPAVPPAWAATNHDFQHRRLSALYGPEHFNPLFDASLSASWSFFAVGGDGTVFLAGHERVVAYDSTNRIERWSLAFPEKSLTRLRLGEDGTVYLNQSLGSLAQGSTLYALDPASGAIRWQKPQVPGISGHAEVMVAGDALYEASWVSRALLRKRRTADGEPVWEAPFSGELSLAALGASGEPLVWTEGGLTLVEPVNGAVRWTIPATMPFISVGSDGTVYHYDRGGSGLIATDPGSGRVRHAFDGLFLIGHAPDGSVRTVMTAPPYALVSLTPSGDELWQLSPPAGGHFQRYIDGTFLDAGGDLFIQSGEDDHSVLHRVTSDGRYGRSWTAPAVTIRALAGAGIALGLDDHTISFYGD